MYRLPFVLILTWLGVSQVAAIHAADVNRAASAEPINVAATDWPWWRGPNRNGIAAADQKPPVMWSDSENVVWKSSIPGRGHGSPTVVGDQVFIATADHEREVQSVLCFDRKTGAQLWQTEI